MPPNSQLFLTIAMIRRHSIKSDIEHYKIQHQVHSWLYSSVSMHDDAFITLCKFDHSSFKRLLHELFKLATRKRKTEGFILRKSFATTASCSRLKYSISCLALVLKLAGTHGSLSSFHQVLGWRFSRRMLIRFNYCSTPYSCWNNHFICKHGIKIQPCTLMYSNCIDK